MKNKNINRVSPRLPAWVISTIILLALDQLSKYIASASLKKEADFIIIRGVLQLHYLENRGAAFGMFNGKQFVFVIIACLIVGLIGANLYRIPAERRYSPLFASVCLITAGALGNMADRIVRGYVIDFIYFSLINFPVFNVADIYICVGIGLFVILLFAFYKDEDFS